MEIRKVKLSIKSKILIVLIFSVLISVFSYCFYAINSYIKDKTAYIFDTVSSYADSVGAQVEDFVKVKFREINILAEIYHQDKTNEKFISNLIQSDKDLIEFTIFSDKNNVFSEIVRISNSKWLEENGIKDDSVLDKVEPSFEQIKSQKFIIKNSSNETYFAFTIYLYSELRNEIYRTRYNMDFIINNLGRESGIKNTLVNSNGKVLYFPNESVVQQQGDISKKLVFDKFLKSPGKLSTSEFVNEEGESQLSAFRKIEGIDLGLISQVSKEEAFKSLKKLITDAAVFALMLLSISISIGIWFSKQLTNPLKKLLEMTSEVSKRNFDVKSELSSNDEIGVLSDSFNFMTAEILKYTGEIEEKARMENELAVAQLVQGSFFPPENAQFKNIILSGYYTPASECGGDWWGYEEIGDKVLLFIGDATGHGVPAALVTATANCAVHLIKDMARLDPKILDDPARIMGILNKVVYKVGGKILMTFFIASFDKETKKLTYSNASHNPPCYYKYSEKEPTRRNIDLLMSKIGPRLGHKEKAEYFNEEMELNERDVLIFYTDGIIEGTNPEGVEYGDRRFHNSFLSEIKNSPKILTEKILQDGYEFFDGNPPDDDITLFCAKIGHF